MLYRHDRCRLLQEDLGYPVLQGRYRQPDVELALVADHVGYRKLPGLRLLVTLKTPIMYCHFDHGRVPVGEISSGDRSPSLMWASHVH